MSCLDVMYPAYGHYPSYSAAAPAFINSLQTATSVTSISPPCRDFMDTPRSAEGMPRAQGTVGGSATSSSSSASSSSSSASSSSSSYTPAALRPDGGSKDKQEGPEAEYLTSRCVLFTYYQGDISTVVDEHFSRALSSYMDGEGKRRASEQQAPGTAETPSPSSRRSFPPSFWDSNYASPQGRPHCETGAPSYSMDPYASGLHPGLPHPHAHPHPHPHAHPHSHPPHPAESWGYPQAQAYGPPRPLHELYSPSALEPHYGPLLMPTVRPPHLATLPSHYEVSKLDPTASWPGLLSSGDVGQTLALNMDAGLQQHKKGKELYWF
ncbi:transcription cofactor vestigial-like protein 2b [Nerophis ophidion]|uniref:transcription cofactor vestigial-like protein 2b n=1 Tax=Nerophis ophidion TaxID=159077 RepID=UPI002AE01E87|nr:transcription cofactor vestigial-like protein 2b [Nerophis ophidion]